MPPIFNKIVLFLAVLCFGTIAISHESEIRSLQAQPITQSVHLPLSNCNMYFITNSSNVTTFYRCSALNFQNYDWFICFKKCCNPEPAQIFFDSNPKISALQNCIDVTLDTNDDNLRTILLIILLAPIVICIIIFVACRKKKENKRINLQRSQLHLRSQINYEENIEWFEQQKIDEIEITDMVVSSKKRKQCPKQLNQICAICLEKMPLTELVCGHRYHIKCIDIWLKKSTKCPCCRHEKIKELKIYCFACQKKFYIRIWSPVMHSKNWKMRCSQCQLQINTQEFLEQTTSMNIECSFEDLTFLERQKYNRQKKRKCRKSRKPDADSLWIQQMIIL